LAGSSHQVQPSRVPAHRDARRLARAHRCGAVDVTGCSHATGRVWIRPSRAFRVADRTSAGRAIVLTFR
jgi:hypothetical protein